MARAAVPDYGRQKPESKTQMLLEQLSASPCSYTVWHTADACHDRCCHHRWLSQNKRTAETCAIQCKVLHKLDTSHAPCLSRRFQQRSNSLPGGFTHIHFFIISLFWTLASTFLLGEQAPPKASEGKVSSSEPCHTEASADQRLQHPQPVLAAHHGCRWAALAQLEHIISWFRNARRSLQRASIRDFLNDNWKLRGKNVFCKQPGQNWQSRCGEDVTVGATHSPQVLGP